MKKRMWLTVFVVLFAALFLSGVLVACSDGNDEAGASGFDGNAVVCTYVQNGDETSYYVFYADGTVESYAKGEQIQQRSEFSYEGDPTIEGTVAIKTSLNGVEYSPYGFSITAENGSLVGRMVQGGITYDTKYTIELGESASGTAENGNGAGDGNGTSGSSGSGGSTTGGNTTGSNGNGTPANGGSGAGSTPSTDVVCTWLDQSNVRNYYIFYTDKTAEYYRNDVVLFERSFLTYVGNPVAAGTVMMLNSRYDEGYAFSVIKSGTVIIATETTAGTRYTVSTTTSSAATGGGTTGGNVNPGSNVNSGSTGENSTDSEDVDNSDSGSSGNQGQQTPTPNFPTAEETSSDDNTDGQTIPFSITFNFTENGGYADAIKTISGISEDKVVLERDVVLAEDSATGIKVTLLATASNKIGSIETFRTNNVPYYKYNNPAAGLIIKNAGFLVSGVTGKVKVTTDWAVTGHKSANDRYMAMAVGENYAVYEGNVDTSSAETVSSVKQVTLIDAYDFGTTGGEIVIGSTNELAIKTVTIETIESVESVVSQNHRSEGNDSSEYSGEDNSLPGESTAYYFVFTSFNEKGGEVYVTGSSYQDYTSSNMISAQAGEKITINTTAYEGYKVESILVTVGEQTKVFHDESYSFTMPKSNVSVDVTFIQIETETTPTFDENYITGVEIIASATDIEATGSCVLSAIPSAVGNPPLTYTWNTTWVEDGSENCAVLSAMSGDSVTLMGRNWTTSSHTVAVSVAVTDGRTTIVSETVYITVGAYSGEEVKKATAATYNFLGDTGDGTGIVLEDVKGYSISTANEIGTPSSNNLITQELKNKAIIAYKGFSSRGSLRFRLTHTENAELTDEQVKTITALNYNGGETQDISRWVNINDLSRYIAIAVDGVGTVTADIKFVYSGSNTGTAQAGLFDQNGNLLGTVLTADITTGVITGTTGAKGTLTAVTTENTEKVYLVYSRNGAGGGGFDVYNIVVTPAE